MSRAQQQRKKQDEQPAQVHRFPDFTQISPLVLKPRLAELGKIKIGGKGKQVQKKGRPGETYRLPTKFDHFVVTRRDRDASTESFVRDADVHASVGDSPKYLDVFCLHDEPEDNFQFYFSAYDGRRARCRGNGEWAIDREQGRIPCTCPLLKQHQGSYDGPERPAGVVCKPYGRLSVVLAAAKVYGGYWTFRTTSWETISAIAASLRHLRREFAELGGLRGLPLRLVIYPATDTYEQDGQLKTSTSYKVSIVLRASYQEAFRLAAAAREWRHQNLLASPEAAQRAREEAVEVRRQLDESDEREATEIAAEFHPETVTADDGGEFYELDDDEEIVESDPIVAVCRRALEIGGAKPEDIERTMLRYEGRAFELADQIERQKPEALAQAKAEAAKAAEAAPQTEAGSSRREEANPAAAGDDHIDLFGS